MLSMCEVHSEAAGGNLNSENQIKVFSTPSASKKITVELLKLHFVDQIFFCINGDTTKCIWSIIAQTTVA